MVSIAVIENVETQMAENGMPRRERKPSIACPQLVTISESDSQKIPIEDVVLLTEGGRNFGVLLCFSHESAGVLDSELSSTNKYHVYVANLEGILDEGMVLGEDFEVTRALGYGDLEGLERSFLISSSASSERYWLYVLEVGISSIAKIFSSSSHGWLLGVRAAKDKNGGDTDFLLIRHAGYMDGDVDIFVTDRFTPGNEVSCTF